MTELNTKAEKLADEARKLPNFKSISLLEIKEQVANLLKMIGRVEGIFSTYSLHDISHVESMLEMLEWLIPPETQDKMTTIDWLLLTLSIYFHDLGMVVTAQEYKNRMGNAAYKNFLDNLNNTMEGKDYLDRVEKMDDEAKNEKKKDEFLYQEFIRHNHASRIREWITNQHSHYWKDNVEAITDEVTSLLKGLPTRFIKNLGDICESHHKSNLDDSTYFPLCQRYGQKPEEVANVQYVALILRTADLLHITKDRTPSVMFKAMSITDPMGLDEWQKQMGTYSVNLKSKKYYPDNPETHIILVSADFEDEKPFFVLSRYLEYANKELEQTRRWAQSSQRDPDAVGYEFPWRNIDSDVRVEGNEPMQMRFELDRGQLLNLLVGHTIYNDPTVAVREILQNAIDAVRFQFYLDNKRHVASDNKDIEMGEVLINWDSNNSKIEFRDTGIGMDLDAIKYHLMKVGASYYNTEVFESEHKDFVPISRFGIGILTCFMVSDNIEIITRREDIGYRIRMREATGIYLLKTLDEGHELLSDLGPHGTKVILKLRPSIDLSKTKMIDIVKHWVILPACSVWFTEDGSEKQRVGFDNIEEAVRYYYRNDMIRYSESKNENKLKILKHEIVLGIEKYEISFAVHKEITPVWNFLGSNTSNAPALCIEGIRVDNVLPGFKYESSYRSGFCAILSVRNNRNFRTTVSRAGIEHDSECIRVSKICIDELFSYIKSEVERISQSEGRPLSRASSAARWLINALLRNIKENELKDYLQYIYSMLPIIVIEDIASAGKKGRIIKRKFVSHNKLHNMEYFWTIESRLVDYLGVISRDLGKELSLNTFVGTLAPELKRPEISPMVCDPYMLWDDINISHNILAVEFSRERQETIIKWGKRDNGIPDIKVTSADLTWMHDNMFRDSFPLTELAELYEGKYALRSAPIKGDIPEIEAVRTKIAVVVKENSKIYENFNSVRELLLESEKYNIESKDRYILLTCYLLMIAKLHQRVPKREYSIFWDKVSQSANDLSKNYDISISLPVKDSDILGPPRVWFDPSMYWYNWYD